MFGRKPLEIPSAADALPGRLEPMPVPVEHHVNHRSIQGPYPDGSERAVFGMGCFWGAERLFWQLPGVWVTAVGYAGGHTPNPDYHEVCSGMTGHTEVVLVVYDPAEVSYGELLAVFLEGHDPTQGMRQGNDVGTQYRSLVGATTPAQRTEAEAALAAYGERLVSAGYGPITTEVVDDPTFYFAEGYHQQYLSKNPNGYCGLGGTGVSCPVGLL